jgi:hypothetical protein
MIPEFEIVDNWDEMFEDYEKVIHTAISDYWKKMLQKSFKHLTN